MRSFVLASYVIAASAIDKDFILREHNIARCMHGAAPLTWDDNMANHATSWSDTIHYSGMRHGGMDFDGKHMGQNLAGSCSAPTPPQSDHTAVEQWMEEESYNGGHYTQVVWKGSQQVGCGMWCGPENGMQCCMVTCDYYPAGNMMGEEGANVGDRVKTRAQCESEIGGGSPSPAPGPAPGPSPSPSGATLASFNKRGSYPGAVFTSAHSDTSASSAEQCAEMAKGQGSFSFIYTAASQKCSIASGNSVGVSYGSGPTGDWYFAGSGVVAMVEKESAKMPWVLLGATVGFVASATAAMKIFRHRQKDGYERLLQTEA